MDCYADKKNNMNSMAKCKVEKIIFKWGFYLEVIVSDNKGAFTVKMLLMTNLAAAWSQCFHTAYIFSDKASKIQKRGNPRVLLLLVFHLVWI